MTIDLPRPEWKPGFSERTDRPGATTAQGSGPGAGLRFGSKLAVATARGEGLPFWRQPPAMRQRSGRAQVEDRAAPPSRPAACTAPRSREGPMKLLSGFV